MRNFITLLVIACIGYFGYSALFRGGDPEPVDRGEGAPVIGRSADDGASPEIDSAKILSGGETEPMIGTDIQKAAADEERGRPVPAIGEIATLEKQISGTLSPDKDDLRIRLAALYRESDRHEEADRFYQEIFRAKGPYAGRAAVALLDRTKGEARATLAAYVVEQGSTAPGYGVAALVHGKELASKSEESAQLEAWRLLSEAYFSRPDESWRAPIRQVLAPIADKWLLSRRPCTLARAYTVEGGDYLARIAEDHDTTVDQLRALNGLDSDLIHPGDRLKILDGEITIEIDKSEFRLDVRYNGGYLMSFPVGHGAEGRTPVTEFVVNIRQEHPDWTPPNRPRVEYGDPGNPLGERWLGFASADGFKGFGIHGTNQPSTIGSEASEGCVRLRNDDVIRLYPFVAVGTKVSITE